MGTKKAGRRRTSASAPCPKCGRAFSRNDSLSRHLKTHGSQNEQRPFHRIISEKFRACENCRRSKIRCTGSMPCVRCERLQQTCSYDQKKRSGSASKPFSSTTPPVEATHPSPRMAVSSPEQSPSVEESLEESLPRAVPSESGKQPLEIATNIGDAITSAISPESTSAMLPFSLSPRESTGAIFFGGGKDFTITQSTYVSPTFHVLDPYSYKLPSIGDSHEARTPSSQVLAHYRYPVLQYLAPFLDGEFGSNLACDLLDTYFSSAFSTRMHPTCHHIHNFILRRRDMLDPVQPRKTHPALIASMLFVAAFSDKALGLFSGPEEKDRVCKYLSLLTYRLLNPSRYEPLLSHEDLGLSPYSASDPGWTNEDLRRALNIQLPADNFPVSWSTDYIISLIHVSSVISGSEKKAASIRWFVTSTAATAAS